MKNVTCDLKTSYITEDENVQQTILKELENHQVIMLVAPQGTGKTTFFKKLNYFLVSPTRALADQENSSYSPPRNSDRFYFLDEVADTYVKAEKYIENHLSEIDYVVFDECHYCVNYSAFAIDQVNYFESIYNLCKYKNKKVIFVTATPDAFYCLENHCFYQDIEVCITIQADRQYIGNLFVYEELTQNILIDLLRKYHHPGYVQVVLFNNTHGIEKIASVLSEEGLKCRALSSQNKDSGENKCVFTALINNEEIQDIDVLLVTSWADVGINIVNSNINHIYYSCDKTYTKGSMISLQQWIARFRNCTPNLHVLHPVLSLDDKKLLQEVFKQVGLTRKEEVIQDLVEKKTESLYYKYMLKFRKESYQTTAKAINDGGLSETMAGTKLYLIKQNGKYIVNEAYIKFELHHLIDKLTLTDIHNYGLYFQYDSILSNDYLKIGTSRVPLSKYSTVLEYLKQCADEKREFKSQKEFKEDISRIAGIKFHSNMCTLIKFFQDELNIELKERKRNGQRVYWIDYNENYKTIEQTISDESEETLYPEECTPIVSFMPYDNKESIISVDL